MVVGSAAPAIVIKKCMKAFYRAGAVGADHAIPLESIGYRETFLIQGLVRRNMLGVKDGKYYMTEEYARSFWFRAWRIDR